MMRNRKNITGINTRITILADIIQKARVVLCADNERIYLNAEETRKIILICLIFYRTKNITFPCETIVFSLFGQHRHSVRYCQA